MDFDELRKLIDTLHEKQVDEIEVEENGRRIRVRRGAPPQAVYAPPAPLNYAAPGAVPGAPTSAPAASALAAAPAEDAGLVKVTSPIVGTYYESPSPGSPEFIRPGDKVQPGQVLCIIEAMKLMNEIEAEVAGEVVRKLVTNGQPVEFGQPLVLIRPV